MKKGYLLGLSLLLAVACSKSEQTGESLTNKVLFSTSLSSSVATGSVQVSRYINTSYAESETFSSVDDIVFLNLDDDFTHTIYAISSNSYFTYLYNSTPLIDLGDYSLFLTEGDAMSDIYIGSTQLNQDSIDVNGNYVNSLSLQPLTGKFSYQFTNLAEAQATGVCDSAKIEFDYSHFAQLVTYSGETYSNSAFSISNTGVDTYLSSDTQYYLPPMLSSKMDDGYYTWWITLFKGGEEVNYYIVKSENIVESGKSLNLKLSISTATKGGELSLDNLAFVVEEEVVETL